MQGKKKKHHRQIKAQRSSRGRKIFIKKLSFAYNSTLSGQVDSPKRVNFPIIQRKSKSRETKIDNSIENRARDIIKHFKEIKRKYASNI